MITSPESQYQTCTLYQWLMTKSMLFAGKVSDPGGEDDKDSKSEDEEKKKETPMVSIKDMVREL